LAGRPGPRRVPLRGARPGNKFIGSFELTAPSEDKPSPATAGRGDHPPRRAHAGALAAGQLSPNSSLSMRPDLDPALVNGIVAKLGPAACGDGSCGA
jgi:hypothetical protein